jgi:hypothetical protein
MGKIYNFLTSGGQLTKTTGFLNIESKAILREKLPFVSILGGMKGNEDVRGKISVGQGVLHCLENGINDRPGYTFLEEINMNHIDKYEGELSEKEKQEKANQPMQMLYSVLAIKKGSKFSWTCVHKMLTPIEKSFFDLMYMLYIEKAATYGAIGGDSRIGMGKFSLEIKNDYPLEPQMAIDFLNNQKKEIKQTIQELTDETYTRTTKKANPEVE